MDNSNEVRIVGRIYMQSGANICPPNIIYAASFNHKSSVEKRDFMKFERLRISRIGMRSITINLANQRDRDILTLDAKQGGITLKGSRVLKI